MFICIVWVVFCVLVRLTRQHKQAEEVHNFGTWDFYAFVLFTLFWGGNVLFWNVSSLGFSKTPTFVSLCFFFLQWFLCLSLALCCFSFSFFCFLTTFGSLLYVKRIEWYIFYININVKARVMLLTVRSHSYIYT